MNLLFDQNLSRHLPRMIADVLPGAAHVRDFGMGRAEDEKIWGFARDQGFTVVSKDDDFKEYAQLLGPPPRVVMLKLGNGSTEGIDAALRRSLAQIVKLHHEPGASLLLITASATFLLHRQQSGGGDQT